MDDDRQRRSGGARPPCESNEGKDQKHRGDQRQPSAARVRGLVPTPSADRPRTKAQETFSSLLARLESLRDAIDGEEERLDAALNFYASEIVPRFARQTALQKELVRALAPHLNPTSFPRRQERLELQELIREFLHAISTTEKGLADTDLRKIYDAVHSVGYAEYERKTLACARDALAQAFADAGLEADFSALDSATSEADFMARAEELTARVRKMKEAELEEAQCRDAARHSPGGEDLREAEESRKRAIAIIYKQLARVLHPDLERDGELQKQKVQLMQELTVAFRENDLHTLLRLEMQWIEKESRNVERLTDEKLGVYNEVLQGQVDGLEKRLRDLVLHPRYRPILTWKDRLAAAIDGPEKARELDKSIASLDQAVRLLKASRTPDNVRAAVRPLLSVPEYPLS